VQHVLRPYATAGVALVGASVIGVTPMVAPMPSVQTRPVQLVDAWSDLVADTTANFQNIVAGADSSAISGVFSELGTNPLGVIDALFNLTPTVSGELPGGLTVELPPGLELLIADLGASATTFSAITDVATQLQTDPSAAFEGLATILNGYLNGTANISLLNGIIDITGFNGILAPLQDVSIDLNLPDLLNALGVGNLSLSNLGVDLGSLLNQLGLGNLDLGGLLSALGLSNEGLGTLLGDPTLSSLLGDLGLGNLGLGSFSLTSILGDLGLDGNVNLDSLSLDSVLSDFGLNPDISVLNDSLSTVLSDTGLLSGVLTDLNSTIAGILTDIPGVSTLLGPLLDSLLTSGNLETALSSVTVGDLLGVTGGDSLTDLLAGLGIGDITPTGLTVGGLLSDLGFSSGTGALTLDGLLSDLGVGDSGITTLLNTVNLGDLLGDLSLNGLPLSDLPLDLSNLGSLGDLTVSGLIGDLGLGDIATVNIDGFGGLATLLADVIPQQILAAL